MKKFFKISFVLVAVISLTFLLTGSSNKNSSSGTELYKIDVYCQTANFSGIQPGWFGKIVKDKFNIEMNIIQSPEGVYATRAASGNLGDLVLFGNNGTEYTDAIEAGLLRPWDDLLDKYGPDIKKTMPVALKHNRDTFGNGKTTYGFGYNVALSPLEYESPFYHPDLRYDLYKKLPANLQKIKTLEDYIPALIEMQKMEREATGKTDIYALSLFPNWDGDAVMFVKALGALYGYDEFGFCHYDVNTKTVRPYLEDGSMYLRALKFFNTAFRAGILDPNSPTTGNGDMIWDKFRDGKVLFGLFKFMSDNYNSEKNMAEGKAMFAVPADDMRPIAYGTNIYGKERVWAIGSKAKYPERIMQLIDWLCTPEGVMTFFWGPKGLTWDYDKNNKAYLTEFGVKALADKNTIVPDEFGGGKYSDGEPQHNLTTFAADVTNPITGEKYDRFFWNSELNKNPSKALAIWRADMSAKTGRNILTPDDLLKGRVSIGIASTFTKASRDAALDIKYKAVSTAIKTNTWLALMASTEDEYNQRVETLISEAKAAGLDECVKWDREQGAIRAAREKEAEKAK